MAIKKVTIADKTTLDGNLSSTKEVLSIVKKNQGDIKRYGVKISKDNSDPDKRIEYTYDAIGFKPAKMDYTTGVFDYGSWGDIWFIKQNYPVLLKSNGEVAYKLNPNDYSKKEDGSSSDIYNSGSGVDGNFMSKIPLVWVSFSEDSNYEYITVAEDKYDESYHAIAHTKEDGTVVNDIYLSIYKGSLYNGKLRSLAAKVPIYGKTADQEINYAKANGDGWFIRTWSQRQLINALLTIIGKSDDTQATFGTGVSNTYVNDESQNYGMRHTGMNSNMTPLLTGQFFGSNDGSQHVKIFHMEDWWGEQFERVAGLINDNGTIKFSMTGPYNTTGEGYDAISCPAPGGISGGYLTESTTGKHGRVPYSSVNGTSSTYLCDGFGYSNSRLSCVIVGGACNLGDYCGANSLILAYAHATYRWDIGACLSYM